ncbi:TetR family transcriptional regulator [Actinomadura pelletieri]|nr:TetR family transcriptional regulator [Actinomadura pelletieri]
MDKDRAKDGQRDGQPDTDVPDDLVKTAIRVAGERGVNVADVPLSVLAEAAGVSRSTLVRRLKGTRRTLDEAVRAAGVDPGGLPVRDRAVAAAASIIGRHGLATVTLEAVAAEAGCSLPSLHAVFQGRDGLLAAVFERYLPLNDLEALMADPPATPEETVRAVLRTFARGFVRERSVFPAVMADVLARPAGPGRQVWSRAVLPRVLGSLGVWLSEQARTGRFKPLPVPILAQLLVGPLAMHMLLRPTLEPLFGPEMPTVDATVDLFADAFLAAVAPERPGPEKSGRELDREN